MTSRGAMPMRRRQQAAAVLWVLLAVVLTTLPGCAERAPASAPTPGRSGRLGSLRDLTLVFRPETPSGGELFVDRFEVTRGDWRGFAALPAGRAVGAEAVPVGGDPGLPVGSLDLRQARAFAQWRCLRLWRRSEWFTVATGDGRSRFPWGIRVDPARANTGELGLGEPVPVGTFESGRRGPDQPYDLVGNVSEWTTSVPIRWFSERDEFGERVEPQGLRAVPTGSPARGRWLLRSHPAMAMWALPGGLLPPALVVEASGPLVPREVVGGDFQQPMLDPATGQASVFPLPAGDRRAGTGLRLCATAAELLLALVAVPTLQPGEAEQVTRFVARPGHRQVLQPVWRRLFPTPPAGELAAVLAAALEAGS